MGYFDEKEKREQLGKVWDDQEAILKTAEAESRDVSGAEQRKLDGLQKKESELQQEIDTMIKNREESDRREANGAPMMAPQTKPEQWTDKEGRALRVYKPGEKVSRSTPEVSLGQMARAMLTGARTAEEKRALAAGTDSSGGFTVPSHTLEDFYDRMRAKAQVVNAGARFINLETDETTIARVASDPTLIMHEENATESASDPSFEGAIFRPKTFMLLVRASRELIADSVNANELLESVFAGTIGAGLDKQILFGTGADGQVKGLTEYNLAEHDMGTDGASLNNYDPLVSAYRKMLDDNSVPPSAYIMAPREWETLATLKDSQNRYLDRPQALDGIPFLDSTNIPIDEAHGTATDASRIVTGNWNDLVIGMRSEMRIELLRERYADSYQYGFLVHMRADALPAREESFAQVVGITE